MPKIMFSEEKSPEICKIAKTGLSLRHELIPN